MQDTRWGGPYPSAEKQSVYFIDAADWAKSICIFWIIFIFRVIRAVQVKRERNFFFYEKNICNIAMIRCVKYMECRKHSHAEESRKTLETLTTLLVQVRNFYYLLDFYVFNTRREKHTQFLLLWLFVQRQLSTHWPNQRPRTPQQTTVFV